MVVPCTELGASDKVLGNSDGWKDYSWKTEQQGAATHVFASFDTSISGTLFPPGLTSSPAFDTPISNVQETSFFNTVQKTTVHT